MRRFLLLDVGNGVVKQRGARLAAVAADHQQRWSLEHVSPKRGRPNSMRYRYVLCSANTLFFTPTRHGTVPETTATREDSVAPEDDHPEIGLLHEGETEEAAAAVCKHICAL